MIADSLLTTARDLLTRDAGRPGQASLKRAVSTAYYAVLHALAYECVRQTVGWHFRSDRYWEIVLPIYRAIDHGHAKQRFGRFLNEPSATAELKQVGRTFIDLQEERIRADYDPRPTFNRSGAAEMVARAERAVTLIRELPADVRRHLAVQLITRQR